MEIERREEKERKLWNKYIQPIVDNLSPLDKEHFSYRYDESLSHQISQIDIIRMERLILVPMFNSLGFSHPWEFYSKVLRPLHQGKETMHLSTGDVDLVQLFGDLLLVLGREGMSPHFLYWLDDWFGEADEGAKAADGLIRSLRVEAVNDSEITIQEPCKAPVTYHCSNMGFRSEKDKTWKMFINTLRASPPLIKLPPRTFPGGGRNKEYDAERKTLNRLNEKLVSFFNKTYSLCLLKGYKLYQRYRPEGDRSYCFIFKIPKFEVATKFEEMPKDALLETIERLARQCAESRERNDASDDTLCSELTDACYVAFEKGYITEDRLEKLIKPAFPLKDADIAEVYEQNLVKYNPDIPDLS